MGMKTEAEVVEVRDEAIQMPVYAGLSYKDGVIAALEWVLGRAEDKPTE